MISENGLVSSDVYFVSVSVVWMAGAWHIKSASPLYNAPKRGCVRRFFIAAKQELGIMTTGKSPFPDGYGYGLLYGRQSLSLAVTQK